MTLVEQAIEFATKAHTGQKRKGNGRPYIYHPLNVGKILARAGFSKEVVAAGILHDVVEDTDITIEEIEKHFGKIVAYLVEAHTEDKSKTWEERKQHTIEVVESGSLEVKALIAADKYDNLQSLIEDYQVLGDKLWDVFKRGYDKQKWYHVSITERLLIGVKQAETPSFFFDFIQDTKTFFK